MSHPAITVHCASESGHRGRALEVLARHYAVTRTRGLALGPKPMLFLVIEDAFARYVANALIRALLGRRTAGLLLRPEPAATGTSLRLCLKRLALRALRRLDAVSTLTIDPFDEIHPVDAIRDGWLYDFELWDLSEAERARILELKAGAAPDSLTAKISAAARGRPVLLALGRQDRAKGFPEFAARAARDETATCWQFVAAGVIAADCAADRAALEAAGGLVIDRRLDDDELWQLYAAADLVWAVYAPDYDQASGIAGRAAQLGIPVCVRAGSRLQAFCAAEGIAHLALAPGTPLPDTPPASAHAQAQRREISLERLRIALFG